MNTNKLKIMHKEKHPFHLVDPSPWPFFTSISIFVLLIGFTMYMHNYKFGGFLASFGLFLFVFNLICWWRDVIREATFEGHHTSYVQKGIKEGMILFIVSEIMFFFAFFWAFFHSSLSPVPEIFSVWPPYGINTINPWEIPLLNTLLLLSSGATLTWCHHSIIVGFRSDSIKSLLFTLILGIIFTLFQIYEYIHATFTISDSIYGSCFYLMTGFHGFHVIIGTIFLFVCFYRLIYHHFAKNHHVGFECAAWYWHFVDVVWLFLFVVVYWWGNI